MNGQELAKAWKEWRESPEGQKCAEGMTTGEYLENRLWLAFMAGATSAPSPEKEKP